MAVVIVTVIGIAACGASGSDDAGGAPITPVPRPGLAMTGMLRFLPIEGDSVEALGSIRISSSVPAEVRVSSITHALVRGVQIISSCVTLQMGSAEAPSTASPLLLNMGDELDVTWSPMDLTTLGEGVYAEQLTVQGSVAAYADGTIFHPEQPDGLLAIDYRPFAVSSSALRLLTGDEYAAAITATGGGSAESTASDDLAPKDCRASKTPAVVSVSP